MRSAFKEWAVIVDALHRGEQILILRKGGIHEGRNGFHVRHSRFLLFPTRFHQQREGVIASAAERFDLLPPHDLNELRLETWAETVRAWRLRSAEVIRALRGQHIWRDDVLERRFDWGAAPGVILLAVRVHRLPAPVTIPMLPQYGGCRSWVELAEDIPTDGSEPVLDETRFDEALAALERTLAEATTGHAGGPHPVEPLSHEASHPDPGLRVPAAG